MKCQACTEAATLHVTEIVAGQPVEYHVCNTHLQSVENLMPPAEPFNPTTAAAALFGDPEFHAALRDAGARQKMAAHLLPALCLGLLDQSAEVRIQSVVWLMQLSPDARPALGALQNALRDPDERVRKAAAVALEHIDSEQHLPWFV
jgi:hypothetical protein